jgi:hypothetical protein
VTPSITNTIARSIADPITTIITVTITIAMAVTVTGAVVVTVAGALAVAGTMTTIATETVVDHGLCSLNVCNILLLLSEQRITSIASDK